MATQVFHFSKTGVSSGQGFYLREDLSSIFLRNLVLDSNSLIHGSNLVYNTGAQTISGNKTFLNSIFYGLGSGNFDFGLRTNISSDSGDSVSFTRGGTTPSAHGYGIVFEGGSIANKKGYLTVGATVAPVGYQYASLDWTNRILSGDWSASSPIRVGSAVSVMTTGNQTISGVKTFVSSGIFNSGIDLGGSRLLNFTQDIVNVDSNFLISGNFNSDFVLANSSSQITGTIVSGNPIGFNASLIQIGLGNVRITGSGSNVIINSFNNRFRTSGQFAQINILHTGNNGYIMYGNTTV
jgi:hypothetical protein